MPDLLFAARLTLWAFFVTGLNINEALADRPTVLLRSWDSWRGQLGTEFEKTRSIPGRVYTGHALRATMLKSY